MSKAFCPKCGNATLIRTTAVMTPNGLQLFLKRNFQYRLRGTIYSIPTPQTGRHAKNLILREDQKEWIAATKKKNWEERKREKAIQKAVENGMDALSFADWDRPVQVGHSAVVGYGRRNPNEGRRRIGKKKKQ